ncbi:MAG TPA: ABC transporter substrate-binding protein [Segeticoccus sp.]|uniref:ABC transporter substrate-binding protein n=1 Tax=Segeticoccus sp. TaxID=2706531 RepID=UPI002D7F3A20|nr:ABC transporter substrate-binding protein [Segeticoccus sp.]HET8600086.1 ABC transporter substrate-binding protein [Segeticoccus sp.]
MRRQHLAALALPGLLALGLTACTNASAADTANGSASAAGGSAPSSAAASQGTSGGQGDLTQPVATTEGAAAKLVPADLKGSGTLRVAMDASYAPFEYFAKDNKTIIGFDADLSKAIGAKMGLKVVDVNAGFDTILAGIGSGKFDLGMSAFSVTPERTKSVDFVTYLDGGTGIAVPAGNPKHLTMNPKHLCGLAIAGQKGSIQGLNYLPQFSKDCQKAGKQPIKVELYPSQNEANLAVSSGRADAVMADSISMAYQSKLSGGAMELAPGADYEPTPTGVAMPNGSKLAPAISKAMHELVADGTMKKIMNKWGIPSQALSANVGKITR